MRIAFTLLIACFLQACAGSQPKPCAADLKWDSATFDQCPTTPKENPK